jgi:tripartite-type tricarboxylate transporter receptor subunit TctC
VSATLKRRALALLLPSLLLGSLPAAAQQAWKPDRPVTLVVPYSPGGGTDALARAVARDMSEVWGQPVVIENLPGADGLIGTRKVIGAKPDGYTLLAQVHAITVAKHLPSANGFDPLADLAPVTGFAQLAGVFVSNPSLPGKTLADAVRHCKTSAKPCSFATTESVARLHGQMLRENAGLENMVIVNYKGGGQVITDLVAGHVDMSIMGITAAMPHYKSGAIKVLATLGEKRTSVTPEIPSAAEVGFPYLDTITWYGIFAPKGTQQDVIEGIAAATSQALKGETVQKTYSTLGAEALRTSPAEFSALVKRESEHMSTLAKRFPLGQ